MHWRDEGSGLCSAGFVVVDGKTYPGRFITGLEEVFRSDGKDKDGTEVPFKFKKLSTSGKAVGRDHTRYNFITLMLY